jgi:hypothetical protein
LFCAVIFALIKASGAINGTVSDPAYQNSPAQAFVPPASVTLVDPTYLDAPRLPDVDYIAVVSQTRALTSDIADLTVTATQLQHAGLSAADAQSTILLLRTNDSTLHGRQFSISQNLLVTPGSNDNSAVVGANVQYSSTAGGGPPLSASESFSYQLVGAHGWQLQSVSLQLVNSSGGISS